MAALHVGEERHGEKKGFLPAAGLSFSCSFLTGFMPFYQLQTAAETEAGIAELQHWHTGMRAA